MAAVKSDVSAGFSFVVVTLYFSVPPVAVPSLNSVCAVPLYANAASTAVGSPVNAMAGSATSKLTALLSAAV